MITAILSPRRIQLFLLLGIVTIAIYFTLRLGCVIYSFYPLNSMAKAQVGQWEVRESGTKYLLKAVYSFETQGKFWNGTYTYKRRYFNEALAVADLKEKGKEPLIVWYNPKNPQNSALERDFPVGLLVRTLICYGVILYFIFLIKKIQSVDL